MTSAYRALKAALRAFARMPILVLTTFVLISALGVFGRMFAAWIGAPFCRVHIVRRRARGHGLELSRGISQAGSRIAPAASRPWAAGRLRYSAPLNKRLQNRPRVLRQLLHRPVRLLQTLARPGLARSRLDRRSMVIMSMPDAGQSQLRLYRWLLRDTHGGASHPPTIRPVETSKDQPRRREEREGTRRQNQQKSATGRAFEGDLLCEPSCSSRCRG